MVCFLCIFLQAFLLCKKKQLVGGIRFKKNGGHSKASLSDKQFKKWNMITLPETNKSPKKALFQYRKYIFPTIHFQGRAVVRQAFSTLGWCFPPAIGCNRHLVTTRIFWLYFSGSLGNRYAWFWRVPRVPAGRDNSTLDQWINTKKKQKNIWLISSKKSTISTVFLGFWMIWKFEHDWIWRILGDILCRYVIPNGYCYTIVPEINILIYPPEV